MLSLCRLYIVLRRFPDTRDMDGLTMSMTSCMFSYLWLTVGILRIVQATRCLDQGPPCSCRLHPPVVRTFHLQRAASSSAAGTCRSLCSAAGGQGRHRWDHDPSRWSARGKLLAPGILLSTRFTPLIYWDIGNMEWLGCMLCWNLGRLLISAVH